MKKLISLLIVLSPLLVYYDFPFTSIGMPTVVSICLLLLVFVENRLFIRKVNREFSFMLMYILLSTAILLVLGRSVAPLSFAILIVNLIIVVFISRNVANYVDFKYLIKAYKAICFVAIALFFLQHIICLTTGRAINFMIPFFPVNESYADKIGVALYSNHTISYSSAIGVLSSCFSEPSHLAVYLLPFVVLTLFSKEKYKLIQLIIISSVIVLTNSGNGIIALAIILLSYAVFNKKKRGFSLFKRVFAVIGVSALLFAVYLFLNTLPAFNQMFSRLFADDDNNVSKAGYRIYRGFYIYHQLPIFSKFFGIGYGQITQFLMSNHISTPFDGTAKNLEYANLIAQFLIYFGVVGFGAFLTFIIRQLIKGNLLSRSFFVSLIALWFSSSMMFDLLFVFFITFAVAFSNKECTLYVCQSLGKNRTKFYQRNPIKAFETLY